MTLVATTMIQLRRVRQSLDSDVARSICNTHPLSPDYIDSLSFTLRAGADRPWRGVREAFDGLEPEAALRQAWSISPGSAFWTGLLFSAANRDSDSVRAEAARLLSLCPELPESAIRGLSRAQRARGWAYLLRRAKLHADERRRMLELESMQWPVPLHPVSVGELTAVPLTCGMDLWEESVAMHHCADLYGERCAAGTTLVLSVRTTDGARKATLAIERRRGDWVLSHAVGPFNRQIGKEFDDLIDATLSLLNAVDSSRRRSLRGPRYRIDVVDNFDHGESWSENTFRSVEAALGEACRICRSGLPSRDEAGREAWLLFGETPIIVELDGAEPANFDALEYINRLCKVSQHA
jgi:hypothetical protein